MSEDKKKKRNTSAVPQKDKAGRGWFVVDVGPGLDGTGVWKERRQIKRRGFLTRKACQEALDEVRRSSGAGTFVPHHNQTIDEFLDEWLQAVEASLATTTYEVYRRMLRVHVRPRIGKMRLRQLDSSVINQMYGQLLKSGYRVGNQPRGLSARTVVQVHAILRKALDAGVRWGRISPNPASLADPPSWRAAKAAGRAVIRAWTPEELGGFLAAQEGRHDYALWVFMATTGCRRGEALGLRWRDLDLGRAKASIRQTIVSVTGGIEVRPTTKTGRSRQVELDPQTVPVLRQHKKEQDERRRRFGSAWVQTDLVFAEPDGSTPHPGAIPKRFDRRVREVDVPRIRLHDLRHTWATLALDAGVHPKVVQERLGHSSIAVTLDIYSHVLPTNHRDAASTIARIIFGEDADNARGDAPAAEADPEGAPLDDEGE